MHNSALLNHHGHDCVAVDFPPLFVHSYDLVYPDVAHKVTGDKNKIVGDDPMGVDIAESVSGCKSLLGSDDWNNLEA